jgi:hypothetical protein
MLKLKKIYMFTVFQMINGWQRPTFTGTYEECQNEADWLNANCTDPCFEGAWVVEGSDYSDPIH